MPMQYPPESRDDTAAGTPQAETVQGNIADLYCPCAATEDPTPVWSFDTGYWKCSRPDLPLHDTTADPPTVPGKIPCQPVNPWNPADHPQMARRQLAAKITQELLDERKPL